MIEWFTEIVKAVGYEGIFILMVFESLGIPIPSEAVVTFAGFLVSENYFDFWNVIVVSTLANLVGSLISYYIGYVYGEPFIIKYGKYIHLNYNHLKLAKYWFGKYGSITVLMGRVTPGIRTYISFPAGIGKMNINKFIIYTFIGSLIWNYFLTFLGIWLGTNWTYISKYMDVTAIIAIVIFIVAAFYLNKRYVSSS